MTDTYIAQPEYPAHLHSLLQRVIQNATSANLTLKELQLISRFIPAKDHTVVKTRSQRSVFLIENSLRREIPNMNTFVSLGFDLDNITVISDHQLQLIPLGAPYPDASSNSEKK